MVSTFRDRNRVRSGGSHGHSFVELLVTTAILGIVAAAILPIASVSRKREKEIQLRRALRDMRAGLDLYHDLCAQPVGGGPPQQGAGTDPTTQVAQIAIKVEDDPDRTCWPKELDVLIDGVETNVPRYNLRFLRAIPRDPFNVTDDEHDGHGWNFISSSDNPEGSRSWNRQNVFDVRSASESQALDGSYYKEW